MAHLTTCPQCFKPTVREWRVASIARPAVGVLALAFTILGNTTGEWLPGYCFAAAAVVFSMAFIRWAARTRDQRWIETARQMWRGDRSSRRAFA